MGHGAEISASVDWSVFDWIPNVNRCRCGAVYRSHYKIKMHGSGIVGVTQDPCPSCGSHIDVASSYSEPETVTLRG